MKINYNKIVKELLNESIIIPNIKFLSFSPDEILKYKDAKEFYIIRPNSYLTDYNLMDFINAENQIFKVWYKITCNSGIQSNLELIRHSRN